VFLTDLKNEATGPAGISSKEPIVMPSTLKQNKDETLEYERLQYGYDIFILYGT